MMQLNTNTKVGKWTLLTRLPDDGRWVCRCDCGTVRQVLSKNLKEGITKSCGCTRQQIHQKVMSHCFQEAAHGTR